MATKCRENFDKENAVAAIRHSIARKQCLFYFSLFSLIHRTSSYFLSSTLRIPSLGMLISASCFGKKMLFPGIFCRTTPCLINRQELRSDPRLIRQGVSVKGNNERPVSF
jgi:hypothetical protein